MGLGTSARFYGRRWWVGERCVRWGHESYGFGGSRTVLPARRLRIKRDVRITLNILGAVLVLFGTTWFLQGINVLPGSFMTGQIRWAIIGGIAVAAGIALLRAANRRGLTGGR